MADVLNRVTKEFKPTVNTPDFPYEEWIPSPDLSNVAGFPSKYWLIQGDDILLMDKVQRDLVDIAETQARCDRGDAMSAGILEKISKLPPTKSTASLEDRVRALEYIVYGR